LSKFQREASIRTMFDLLLLDRLDQLEDSDVNNKLCVAYEVPMSVMVKKEHGGGKISGRADWSLGNMSNINNLEQMLVVIEAKLSMDEDNNIAQLLAYMYAVQDARVKSKKASTAVFGILTSFGMFRFYVLRETRKAMQSAPLSWAMCKNQVTAFFDYILLDAIKSSPHTTPQKTANSTIKNFDKHLQVTHNFVGEEGDTGDIEESDVWDVAEVDGVSVLIPHAHRSDPYWLVE
jgi:hypothetical protein